MKKKELLKRITAFILAVLMVFVTISTGIPVTSYAANGDEDDDSDSGEIDVDAMKEELEELEAQKKEKAAEAAELDARIAEKAEEVEYLSDQVDQKQEEIEKKQVEIDDQSEKIAAQQEEIEERYEGLGDRLRTMYKNGSIGFFDVLLGSTSFSELLSNLEMVKMIYASDKNTLEELHDVYNELKDALDKLSAAQDELSKAKEELQEETKKAEAAQAELEEAASEVYDTLEDLEAHAAEVSAALVAEQERIEAELEAKRREEERRKEEARKAAEAQKSAETKARIEELKALISRLEDEIEALEDRIDNYAGTDEISGRIAEAKDKVERLQAELDAIDTDAEDFDEEAYNEKIAARDEAQSTLEALQLELEGMEDIDSLNEKLESLKAQKEEAQAELDELDPPAPQSPYQTNELYGGGQLGMPLASMSLIWGFGPRNFAPSTNHRGIDLIAPQGTPIYAAAAGICTDMTGDGWNYGWGNVVFVSHGYGVTTTYAHMSQRVASAGDYVEKGQLIGYSGNTGNSYGAHLHFEVWYNGVQVDPAPWLGI